MAQGLSLQRVLTTEERSGHYAREDVRAEEKGQARACPAQSVARMAFTESQSTY